MRIGFGFDVHAFTSGRPLVIGGTEIPFELGLAGYSDADVLLHAVSDALLGAASEHDIGHHFPDSDPLWAGVSSLTILRRVNEIVRDRGYEIVNIDSVVVAQRPKLSPYIDKMRAVMATALDITVDQVMVKATTTEKLGFTGRGEGIAAQAVCLLTDISVNE